MLGALVVEAPQKYEFVGVNLNQSSTWEPREHIFEGYPVVNVYITMENHHFQWLNPLFLWPFSIANRGYYLLENIIVIIV